MGPSHMDFLGAQVGSPNFGFLVGVEQCVYNTLAALGVSGDAGGGLAGVLKWGLLGVFTELDACWFIQS